MVEAESWEEFAEKREESRSRRRGFYAQTSRFAVPFGPTARRLVEMEDRSVHDRRRFDLRAKGIGQTFEAFYRLHFRRLERDGELVPFAKAYSGLTDAEIRRVDNFVRRNTNETFGPVRSVTPQLVFELAFEAIQKSTRHKSGVAVRFPRILRWREDKTIKDADSLETIHALKLPETNEK